MADDLKLKGPVREIGIIRDTDRHDSFNITIGITIKTEGKVTYEEAERLSTKFRREYLGKDVEFRTIHIPCPHCEKILNSETGLKQHILKMHPGKVELITPLKVAAKVEASKKKTRSRVSEKPTKKDTKSKIRLTKKVKTAKPKAASTKTDPAPKKTRSLRKMETPMPVKPKMKTKPQNLTPTLREPAAKTRSKPSQKAKQLTLA